MPQEGTIVWRQGRTPNYAIADYYTQVPYEVADAFRKFVQRTAGGSLRQNSGRRWPVRTGYSRDRFLVRKYGRRRTPPTHIIIHGASYAPFVDRRGPFPSGSILAYLFYQFARSAGKRQAERRVARSVQR